MRSIAMSMNHRSRKGLLVAALLALGAYCSAQNIITRLVRRSDAPAIALRYRVKLIDRTTGGPFALFRAKTAAQAELVQKQMRLDRRIVWAEDDDEYGVPEDQGLKGAPYKGSTLPAVGDRTILYKGNENVLKQINFDKNAALQSGRTVRVAIIDTGLSPDQAYLWAKVDYSANFVEPGQAAHDIEHHVDTNGDGTFDGAVGHGTMVAGVVDQIAPTCRFSVVRIADSDGIGTAWNLIKGLTFAVTTGCELANVSMGAQNQLPALSDVMDWCESQNLLVVASLGNDNLEHASFPARIGKVVSVGGLNPDNTKAPFSNWDGHCHFSAPATGIISQWFDGRIGIWSGTSFSAPMVTGAIADGLKKTSGRIAPGTLRSMVKDAGSDLNAVNPLYKDKLGKLLDVRKISARIAGGA